jgi:hypothetical protein
MGASEPWLPAVFGLLTALAAVPGLFVSGCVAVADEYQLALPGVTVTQDRDSGAYRMRLRGFSQSRDLELGDALTPRAHRLMSLLKLGAIPFAALSLLMLLAGLGLMARRPWGRSLALLWGFTGFAAALLVGLMVVPEVSMQTNLICQDLLGNYQRAHRECPTMGAGEGAAVAGVLAIYPLITLLYMSSLRVGPRPAH